jgi:hypothetical protein
VSTIIKAWFFSILIAFSKGNQLCDPAGDIDLSGVPQLVNPVRKEFSNGMS